MLLDDCPGPVAWTLVLWLELDSLLLWLALFLRNICEIAGIEPAMIAGHRSVTRLERYMERCSARLTCHALDYRPKCQPSWTRCGAACAREDEKHTDEADYHRDEANTEEAGETKFIGQ